MASTSTTTTTRSGSIAGAVTLILMALALCSLTAVICIAAHVASVSQDAQPDAGSAHTSETLPAKCRQYYNDGTGRWIECMGVGLK